MALSDILKPDTPATPPDDPQRIAEELNELTGSQVYADSVTIQDEVAYFICRRGPEKLVGIAYKGAEPENLGALAGESGEIDGLSFRLDDADAESAEFLRESLSFLKPRNVGLATSLGLGDRLGIATAGHAMAIRGTGLAPYFCQQSIREMTRTGRTPRQVQATASLGALQAGWRGGYGSDADHLKTSSDIDYCLEAGFTMFTFDPGDHVDDAADKLSGSKLAARFETLPWNALEISAEDCRKKYAGKSFALRNGPKLEISEEQLLRAAAKYGKAVAHVVEMYRYLVKKARSGNFEMEVSVDETNSPTSVAEHYYVAAELKRLGLEWVSLAPRFVGRFEKGVDYIGDLDELRETLVGHAAVARTLGPYKLSIHSGSDKFSVYPLAAEAAGGLVHVKTAGTSYLEALRALAAGANRELFREILAFALKRYEEDKKTYHVSADMRKALKPDALKDEELAPALDQFDTRQALHVTFGSVLNEKDEQGALRFKTRMMSALAENEELHYEILGKHIGRHAAPFARE
jgi:tagaturonate epimerase